MTRILIYVQNEEIEALKPLAERLVKKGAMVNFSAIKYLERGKCEQALTLPKYLDKIKALFAGTDVAVKAIEDDEPSAVKLAAAPEVVELTPEADIFSALATTTYDAPAPVVETPAEEVSSAEVVMDDLAAKQLVAEAEEVQITVSETAAKTPSRRRR